MFSIVYYHQWMIKITFSAFKDHMSQEISLIMNRLRKLLKKLPLNRLRKTMFLKISTDHTIVMIKAMKCLLIRTREINLRANSLETRKI